MHMRQSRIKQDQLAAYTYTNTDACTHAHVRLIRVTELGPDAVPAAIVGVVLLLLLYCCTVLLNTHNFSCDAKGRHML